MVHIAVLGSCTVDIVFQMERFPLPGETLFARSSTTFPGGKGLNQAIAVARLGATVTLIGRVGQDAFGDLLYDTAAANGIDPRYIARDPVEPSGMAVPVVVEQGANSILASPNANLHMRLADVDAAAGGIRAAGALLLQFEAPMEVNLHAASIARAAGVPVILNPAPVREFPEELLTGASVLVVNEVEAAMLAPGSAGPVEQATALLARGPGHVIVTLGPEGGFYAERGQPVQPFRSFPVAAVDTVGAGDAFCGALAVALAGGEALGRAVRFASAAAAISVTRAGAAPSLATRDEVAQLLAANP